MSHWQLIGLLLTANQLTIDDLLFNHS